MNKLPKKLPHSVDEEKELYRKIQLKKDIAEKAKPKCKRCGRYRNEQPQCLGHDDGGAPAGGSNEVSSSGGGSAATSSYTTGDIKSALFQKAEGSVSISLIEHDGAPTTGEKIAFNPETISKLLFENKISINNNPEMGRLVIEIRPGINFTDEEKDQINKFINRILDELQDYKDKNNIKSECMDTFDNQIVITLPVPILYDNFIQILSEQKLLPKQNIKQMAEEAVIYPKDVNLFDLTPMVSKAFLKNDTYDLENEDENALRKLR